MQYLSMLAYRLAVSPVRAAKVSHPALAMPTRLKSDRQPEQRSDSRLIPDLQPESGGLLRKPSEQRRELHRHSMSETPVVPGCWRIAVECALDQTTRPATGQRYMAPSK